MDVFLSILQNLLKEIYPIPITQSTESTFSYIISIPLFVGLFIMEILQNMGSFKHLKLRQNLFIDFVFVYCIHDNIWIDANMVNNEKSVYKILGSQGREFLGNGRGGVIEIEVNGCWFGWDVISPLNYVLNQCTIKVIQLLMKLLLNF